MQRYSHTLTERARDLWKPSTKAETILWKRLRNYNLEGFKFKRQHRLGNYIVDFYCSELRLVIELDGAIHNNVEERIYDASRENDLRARGLRILHVKNEEVVRETEKIAMKILAYKSIK